MRFLIKNKNLGGWIEFHSEASQQATSVKQVIKHPISYNPANMVNPWASKFCSCREEPGCIHCF